MSRAARGYNEGMALTDEQKREANAARQRRFKERRRAGNAGKVTQAKPVTVAVTPVESGAARESNISEGRGENLVSGARPDDGFKSIDGGAALNLKGSAETIIGAAGGGNVAVLEAVKSPVRNRGRENLIPWKPGQSGNAAGRPSMGASVREWWNQLQFKSEAEWEAIYADKSQAGNKRQAVRMLLDGFDADGQVRHRAMEMMISHTAGKATQHVEQRVESVTVSAQVHIVATDTDVMAAAQRLIEMRKSSISK